MVKAEKFLPVRIKASQRMINPIKGIVVTAFPVFGFMIDYAVLHFDFACVIISLKIRHIIIGVPEAKLDEGEKDGSVSPLLSYYGGAADEFRNFHPKERNKEPPPLTRFSPR